MTTDHIARELLEAAKDALGDVNSLPYLLRPHSKNCEMQMEMTECQCRCGAAQRNGETVARLSRLRAAILKAEKELQP